MEVQQSESDKIEQINNLQSIIKPLHDDARKHERVMRELDKLKKQWSEAQTTLGELGIECHRVTGVRSAREGQIERKQYSYIGTWSLDSMWSKCLTEVVEVIKFLLPHHCRNCGEIFCNSCSEQLAPLPDQEQFGEPVRVCDGCWDPINAINPQKK